MHSGLEHDELSWVKEGNGTAEHAEHAEYAKGGGGLHPRCETRQLRSLVLFAQYRRLLLFRVFRVFCGSNFLVCRRVATTQHGSLDDDRLVRDADCG
jgi:hypothetical protein